MSSSSSSSSSAEEEARPPLHDGGFQTLLNFRDVAATVNAHQARRVLREGLLYRSARPDEATPADRARLRAHYGLRTVIDLRSKTEHAKAAEKRAATAATVPTTTTTTNNNNNNNKIVANVPDPADPSSSSSSSSSHLIPGVTYREVRVTGPGFERHMLSQLTWWAFLRLVFLYAVGQRMAAVAVLGREVMAPRGLLGLGCDTLDASGAEIAAGLEIFLEGVDEVDGRGHEGATMTTTTRSNGSSNEDVDGAKKGTTTTTDNNSSSNNSNREPLPLLIHCTQGKDRTGLMVALVLLACRVSPDAVAFDYELTDEKLLAAATTRGRGHDDPAARRSYEERLAEIREMGLPDSFGRTCPGFVPGVVAHLREKYGGLDAYLDGIGFGPAKRVRLREKLLC